MSKPDDSANKPHEELYPEEEVSEGDWTRPQLDIKEVEVITGEEDEEVFWQHRAKLYRWAKENALWKERGIGEAKLLQHKTNKKIRFLLRQEKTLKIIANHYVYRKGTLCELKPHVSSDKIWVWTVTDYSDADPKLEQFALKFGQLETAGEFKKKFEEAGTVNSAIVTDPVTTKELSTAKTDAKPDIEKKEVTDAEKGKTQ